MSSPVTVILASASQSRARLLQSAGISFKAVTAGMDETSVKSKMRAQGRSALQCAEALAELKAAAVSRNHPECTVIAADQLLECDGVWFDKPHDMNAAKAHLQNLSGKTHTLPTAAVAIRTGDRVWQHLSVPRLTMRPLTEAFITAYLDQAGTDVLQSVGAYQLEKYGAQLFQAIEGDFFTILGLPLLPLLAFLREDGLILR